MSNRLGATRAAKRGGPAFHHAEQSEKAPDPFVPPCGFGQCLPFSSAESRRDSAPPATSAPNPVPAPRNVECPRCLAQTPALLDTMVLPGINARLRLDSRCSRRVHLHTADHS